MGFKICAKLQEGGGGKSEGEISASEILASETLWIKNLQISLQSMGNFEKTSRSLGLFTDTDVLRAGGRLKNSALPLDTVHPMILTPVHHVCLLYTSPSPRD